MKKKKQTIALKKKIFTEKKKALEVKIITGKITIQCKNWKIRK